MDMKAEVLEPNEDLLELVREAIEQNGQIIAMNRELVKLAGVPPMLFTGLDEDGKESLFNSIR